MIEIKKALTDKSNILNFFLIFFIFFLDRFSKFKIVNYFTENNSVIYVNDYINLDLIWNKGIGFGLFNLDGGLLYHLVSLLIFIIMVVIIYLIFISKKIDKFFYSIVFGGALGNFYDRVTFFAVPDFIDLHYYDFHWFTFNIADIFISLGIVFLILNEIIYKKI
tara:strand:+ start:2052 stop:2543 length:492 start_codon:yes stop_codon:yes gene_type:complete